MDIQNNNIKKILLLLNKFGENLSIICDTTENNFNCKFDKNNQPTEEDMKNIKEIKKLLGDKYKDKLEKIKLLYETYKKDGKGYIKFKFSDGHTSVVSFKDFEEHEKQAGGGLFSKKSTSPKSSQKSTSPKSGKSSFGSMASSAASGFSKDFSSNLAANMANKFSPNMIGKNLSQNLRKPFGSSTSKGDTVSSDVLITNQQIISDIRDIKSNITEKVSIPINQQLDSFNRLVSQTVANNNENKKTVTEILTELSKISTTTENLSTKIEKIESESRRTTETIQDFLNKIENQLDTLKIETAKILNNNSKLIKRIDTMKDTQPEINQ